MSRTSKDAPAWVQRNRVRTRTRTVHRCQSMLAYRRNAVNPPLTTRHGRECDLDTRSDANTPFTCWYESGGHPLFESHWSPTKSWRRISWHEDRAKSRQSIRGVLKQVGVDDLDDSDVRVQRRCGLW